MPNAPRAFRLFLGGADLEMETIGQLGADTLGLDFVENKGLRWGACASAYLGEILASLACAETPVLVELRDDLPAAAPRERLIFVDHHDERAGSDKPSSLRQIFELLALPKRHWTRECELIEANDVGHIAGLRRVAASQAEIIDIRARDRRAQGISEEVELASRAAVEGAQRYGELTIVETQLTTSSAITDFLQPELGGPGVANLLVVMPATLSFFGDGRVIAQLADVPGSWRGGALPQTGFWGVTCADHEQRASLTARIRELAE